MRRALQLSRKGAVGASESSLCADKAREGGIRSANSRRAVRWIHDYLNVKCEEDSPSEKVKFIDRFFISEFYDTVYTKEEGCYAVPYRTFHRYFTLAMKERNVRWRQIKDHGTCPKCQKWYGIADDPDLRYSDIRKERRDEWYQHKEQTGTDMEIYESIACKARRPGSRTLSLCTDKAASRNTVHPRLKRGTETKATKVAGGQLKFAVQGLYHHGKVLQMFGLYPWVKLDTNYWWTCMVTGLQSAYPDGFDKDEVYIQVDGGSENWCKHAFVLGPLLLEQYPQLQTVTFNRMEVGHTHNDLDQKFGIMYEACHGRHQQGGRGQHLLSHTAWLETVVAVFAAAAVARAEKVEKRVKRRRRRRAARTSGETDVWTEKHEPMEYRPLAHTFNVQSVLAPLIHRSYGGYGPIRKKELKKMGHESIHVKQFYRGKDGSINWRYKTFMRDKEWIDPAGGCSDVYKTILTERHRTGPLAKFTAREVLQKLGAGDIVPPLAPPDKKWWVQECKCGCSDPKCCKCPCRFTELREKLRAKLEAIDFISEQEVADAVGDWEAWFVAWASPDAVLEKYPAPVWKLPPVPVPVAASESKGGEADHADFSAELAELARVQITHAMNTQGRKKAQKAAQAAFEAAKQATCLVVQSPPIPAKTMVVCIAPNPDASHSDSEDDEPDEPSPFYIGQLLEPTQPGKGGEFEVNIHWWIATKNHATKFQGPYQVQNSLGDKCDYDSTTQHSIIWYEDKPVGAPDYSKRKRKLFYAPKGGRTTSGRKIQAAVCGTLNAHPDVHSGYFAYDSGKKRRRA